MTMELSAHYPTVAAASLPRARAVETHAAAFDLSCLATLLTLTLYGPDEWYSNRPMLALTVAALLWSRLRTSKLLWCGCLALSTSYVVFNFHRADNHKFLMAYWTLAMFLSLHALEPGKTLARSARWLIGAVMALATFWKLVSPDYMNGQFFAHEMLFDPRFRSFAQLVGGVEESLFEANRLAMDRVTGGVVSSAQFVSAPGVLPAAKALSWFGVGLEASIAACFLAPSESVLGRYRDVPLMCFVLFVYPIATVMGFGYLLASMGLAQARTDRQIGAYLLLLVLMQLFPMPWGMFL
jgi:hypothetical protein